MALKDLLPEVKLFQGSFPIFKALAVCSIWCCAAPLFGQQNGTSTAPLDSMKESHVRQLRMVGITDTAKTIVRAIVKETGQPGEAIQGATVLLRRDKDKMLGRVTKMDGRCNFMPLPADYAIRVQLTGYKSLDVSGFKFEAGKVYEIELRMARN